MALKRSQKPKVKRKQVEYKKLPTLPSEKEVLKAIREELKSDMDKVFKVVDNQIKLQEVKE